MSSTPTKTPRGAVLPVRVTDQELDAIDRAAARKYLSRSAWVRSVLLAAASSDDDAQPRE